jgi:uncharacterized repeat protein (TIGR03847 family)
VGASFDFAELDHLTAGTVGPPGQRVFYLQAASAGQLVSLRLEKTQMAALVQYLQVLLADLPPSDALPEDLELREPVVAEWVVGTLGVSYDEADDRVLIVAEELVIEDEGEGAVTPDDVGVARWRATRAQVSALTARGAEVVAAGRPACALCGLPMDPEGHVCPRLNGHRTSS